ncbi:hypothetical protein [Salinibacterium sp. M195]|uniref:hypothetical protein n=1 Tax=Salinibacterium sp. M195 TaxID=2583374 RepID=UPI001C634826|nr:hypothetical protein [Salinibacterium sp. M195]QYH34968.1 hypothetical protein FFT87_02825 [Salinibacterium sp. M195]
MTKITVFLYRVGATVANVAQSFLQTAGGGNGDPQVFDETAKRGKLSAPRPAPSTDVEEVECRE